MIHSVWSFGSHHAANIVCITRWGLTLSFLQPRCNPMYSQTMNHYVRTNAVFFLRSWIATEMSHDKRKWLPSAMWIHLLWSYSQHHQECYKAFWLKQSSFYLSGIVIFANSGIMLARALKQSNNFASFLFPQRIYEVAVIALGAWIWRLWHFYIQFRLRYKSLHPQLQNTLCCVSFVNTNFN